MTRLFRVPAGTVFPATLRDYKFALAGRMSEAKWTQVAQETVMAPPYAELERSWLANGIEEVSSGDVPER